MNLLGRATDWTNQTLEERAEACAAFLFTYRFLGVAEHYRTQNQIRARADTQREQRSKGTAMADRPTRNCNLCDDTGYKDYAGFAMDPCDHQQPAPVAHGMADLLTKAIGDITAALILAGKKDKIAKWTAPYVQALNEYDAAEPAGEEPVCISDIIRDVAELPDRDSPEDWPEAMLVTGEELRIILERYLPVTPTNPERLVEALRLVEQTADTHYTARNGRRCSIEGSDGEMCSIIPFDTMEEVRTVLAALPAAPLKGDE